MTGTLKTWSISWDPQHHFSSVHHTTSLTISTATHIPRANTLASTLMAQSMAPGSPSFIAVKARVRKGSSRASTAMVNRMDGTDTPIWSTGTCTRPQAWDGAWLSAMMLRLEPECHPKRQCPPSSCQAKAFLKIRMVGQQPDNRQTFARPNRWRFCLTGSKQQNQVVWGL